MIAGDEPLNATAEAAYDDSFPSSCEPSSPLADGTVVLPVLFYLVFSLGLLGNSAVLGVLLHHVKLKTMTDVFLLNLSLSDLLIVLSLPLWASNFQNSLLFAGDTPCKLMTGIYQLGFYSGTLFVTLMSIDRYLAIVHAVAARQARTLRYGVAVSIAIWVVSIALVTPQVVFAEMVVEEDLDSESGVPMCQVRYPDAQVEEWKLFHNVGEITVGLLVGFPVMTFCYARIFAVLRRSRISKKGRAMKMTFAIVCVFVVCWVPYNITVLLQTLQLFDILNTCDDDSAIGSALDVTQIIALTHCCVNPVIYAFVVEKFRRSLIPVLSRVPYLGRLNTSRASENDTTNTLV